MPYNEGMTIAVRYSGSRRGMDDLSQYPYPEAGTAGDGTQDANQGELAFSCPSFETKGYINPAIHGYPHTAVTTTAANLSTDDIDGARIIGVLMSSCMEGSTPTKGALNGNQSNPNNTEMAALISGKATIKAHTGTKKILSGQKILATVDKVNKHQKTKGERNILSTHFQPQFVTAERVSKWSVRTEAEGNLLPSPDDLRLATSQIISKQAPRRYGRGAPNVLQLHDNLCTQLRGTNRERPPLTRMIDSLDKWTTHMQLLHDRFNTLAVEGLELKEDELDSAKNIELLSTLITNVCAYKNSLGTPIGVALSDTLPGRPLTVLLCGGGSPLGG
jgi:hypothetical protein